MKREIIRIEIENEMDIVLAHKHAIQLGELTGMSISDQTNLATAISEIARNCIEYSKTGTLVFFITELNAGFRIEARIADNGPGISNLEEILHVKNPLRKGRGRGIVSSRRLVDHFEIRSEKNRGTDVILSKKIPQRHPPINTKIIEGWKQYFESEKMVSPYEEIKKRNAQLLEMAEQLKVKQLEAENQLEQNKKLMRELEKTNNGLNEFAYTLSHDLKTPLTSLMLWSSMALATPDPEKQHRFVEKIVTAAKRLNDTIMDLIQIIDVQHKAEDVAERIDLNQLIKEIIADFSVDLKRNNAVVHVDAEVFPEIIYIKPFLRSILSNLLSNAIKYRSEARNLEVSVKVKQQENGIILIVEDNGIGMDLSKTKDELFKPFKRFNDQAEGRGIGLHIIKNMIEKNNGSISVESTPGQGTRFTCYLNAYASDNLLLNDTFELKEKDQ